jgi:hypothetical protein
MELKHNSEAVDARALSEHDLRKRADKSEGLTRSQKESLFCILSNCRAQYTSRPGLCKFLEYEFEVQCSEPIVGHAQPIPF